MRLLLVNHTASVSGGEQALLDLLDGLADGEADVEVWVAAPAGELADALRARGHRWLPVPGTSASLRLHPTGTARALSELLHLGWAVRRAARRTRADLVHANSSRAGLAGVVCRALGGPPLVVHEHDVLPAGTASRLVLRLLGECSSTILANSQFTAERLGRDTGPRARIRVVLNPVDVSRFTPATGAARPEAVPGLPPGATVLAVVAQITPWKGQDDAVRALAELRAAGRPVELLLAGEVRFSDAATRYDNPAYLRGLMGLVCELGVEPHVHFLGQVRDVPALLRGIDVLLMPSWEEPFGLAVVEALASGVPVVATTPGGAAEIVRDGVEGRLVPARDPRALARAVEEIIDDADLRSTMARAGRRRAVDAFSRSSFVRRVLEAYADVGTTGAGRSTSSRR